MCELVSGVGLRVCLSTFGYSNRYKNARPVSISKHDQLLFRVSDLLLYISLNITGFISLILSIFSSEIS